MTIDKDEYLLSLLKYIHLNPLRAKIVKGLREYRWSSHHTYVKKEDKNNLIETDQILRMFSEDKTKARRLYKAFMGDESAVKKDDIYTTVDQRILGGEKFVEKILDKYGEELSKGKRKKEYTLTEIARGVERIYRITIKQIRQQSKSQEISLGRKLMTLVANEYGYKGKEIAEYIRKDPAVITRHLKERNKLKKEVEKVIGGLMKTD